MTKNKKKLGQFTRHSIPRSLAKRGNPLHKRLQGLLEKEVEGSLMGTLCATLALISDRELIEDSIEGSPFNYRDKIINEQIYPSVFFAHEKLYPDVDSSSKHIDTSIIPTGAEIIISTRADEICDLFISILSD